MNTKKQSIITDCMDILSKWDLPFPAIERHQILNEIIDTLGSYPKPRKSKQYPEPHQNILGAYLCISTVRNACKLALIKVWSEKKAEKVIRENLETALSLLID